VQAGADRGQRDGRDRGVEQALGDAIAPETGVNDPQQRIVAAELASVHRVLFAEGTRRVLLGQPCDEIRLGLADTGRRAFDLLEPSLGGYGVSAGGEVSSGGRPGSRSSA
jgi:hypothetical protein